MERHAPSGQFYNWYDDRTGAKLTTWPPTGDKLIPHLSSVDNGWLAVGLQVVAGRVPELRTRAQRLFDSMDFSFYYRPARNGILFNYEPDTGHEACCYDTIVSESRIASYIGIEKGELPPRQYYGPFRAFPVGCDPKVETRPVGFTRTYLGQSVFEGALPYNGTRVTPSWGGSMFEALMPSLFLPEERWGPGSWLEPPAHRAGADPPRDDRGRLRLLGLLAGQHPGGRLHGLRRRRDRDGPRRQPVQRGQDAGRPRLPGLPGPRPATGPAAVRLHQRRRDAARRLPRPALGAARGDREPAQARAQLPRHVRQMGLPRLRQRRLGPRLAVLPLTRPGHDHGRDRQRARRRRAAPRVRHPGDRAHRAPADRGGGVQQPTRAAARSRARRATTGCAGPRATT